MIVKIGNQYIILNIQIMKNALNFIFLFLAVFPLTMYAQQEEFPAGTVPNEHNINGVEYPG